MNTHTHTRAQIKRIRQTERTRGAIRGRPVLCVERENPDSLDDPMPDPGPSLQFTQEKAQLQENH